jgi:hypothetical protein
MFDTFHHRVPRVPQGHYALLRGPTPPREIPKGKPRYALRNSYLANEDESERKTPAVPESQVPTNSEEKVA